MNEERSTRSARGPRVRRTAAAALATTVGVTLLVPAVAAAANGFPDVPASSPHAGAIEDLADRGVVRGKADGTYGVADLLTRGQLASMLARADGLAPRASGPFADVSGPHAGAINALAERGIIEGKGDGRFDPNGTIKRDQVASMIARYLELPSSTRAAFDDVPSANVHAGAIDALAAIDVARGDDGRYQPRRDLRRDQAASFVSRGLAYAEGRPGPGPGPGPGPAPAPDCPDLDAPVPGSATGSEVDGSTPTVTVSDTSGLELGDTITVTGSGFDPTSNTGTRPPLLGQAAGVYVVFGNFADEWRPSEGAAGSARSTSDTRWVLPESSAPVPPFDDTQQAQRVDLEDDGSFTTTLEVTETTAQPGGADGYGVFVYPGSGASNPNHELEVRTSLRGQRDVDIEWGVKRSFRDYIAGPIAKGTVATTGDVTQASGNGAFTWGADGLVVGGEQVARSTDGVVTFRGHDGALHVELSDLQVVLGGDDATLYADVCSRSLQRGEDVGYADVHLADLTIDGDPTGSGDRVTVTFDAALAETGVAAFADFYEAGEPLDQLLLHVPAP